MTMIYSAAARGSRLYGIDRVTRRNNRHSEDHDTQRNFKHQSMSNGCERVRRRKQSIQLCKLSRRQLMVERTKVLFQPLTATGFRNNDDIIAGEQPGKGCLRRSHAVSACEIGKLRAASEFRLFDGRIGHDRNVPLTEPWQEVPFDAAAHQVVEQLVGRDGQACKLTTPACPQDPDC